ncbi:MAG: hypothetical protein WC378_00045 [Opitutaceae bacterium]|jgi:phage gpG-like protein
MKRQTIEQFAEDLNQIPSRIRDVIPQALEKCKPIVDRGIFENFVLQSNPDGVAWPTRKIEGDGHPLLVETNTEGSGSLMAAASGMGGGHVSRVEGNALLTGVDKDGGIGGIPGAGVHNYGFQDRNIPQREFLGLGEVDLVQCGEVILDALLEAF